MKRTLQIKNKPVKPAGKSEDVEDYLDDEEEREDEERDQDNEEKSIDDEDDEEIADDSYEADRKKKIFIFVGIGIAVVLVIVIFLMMRGGDDNSTQPVVTTPQTQTDDTTAEPVIDPVLEQKEELYKNGIGKEYISEQTIYEQGTIEDNKFRKDFLNNDATEMYKRPLKVVTVNDSVSYVKHRTITDDGMDLYWVAATYKGKKTEFTISYYIYQALAPEGVMDVAVETITDDDDKVYITSMTALPLSQESE